MIAPWLEVAWQPLAASIRNGRVAHAWCLSGPAGLGKRALARDFAAALLCLRRQADGRACGSCRACRLVAADSHPDRVFVTFGLRDDGTPRTELIVEQVRALSIRLAMTSQFGGTQVAIVDPADALNTSAANALLKTLEEPSANTVIVLVADRLSGLPATIRSRCQRVDLRFPPREQALQWLQARGANAGDAELALDLSAGNPGRALELAGEGRERSIAVARDISDLAERRALPAEVTARWLKDEPGERLALAADWVRAASWAQRTGQGPVAVDAIARLTGRCDFHKLAAWWGRANVARAQLKTPLRSDLVLLEVLHEFRELA